MNLREFKDAEDDMNDKLRRFCRHKGYMLCCQSQYSSIYVSVYTTPGNDSTLKVDEGTGFHISLENKHVDRYEEVLEFLKTITLGENDEAI
jgi:hypothetical protein